MNSFWFFNRKPVTSIEYLLKCYDAKEFRSPTRSTIPLLSLLKDGATAWQDVLTALGVSTEVEVQFEFQVAPPVGKGIPSHTDVMLLSDTGALAVEAKWTETRYDTVGKWLQKGSNLQNRQAVIQGWLGMLQPYARRRLELQDMLNSVYQMVHRAASACSFDRKPKLAYLQFTPLPNQSTANVQQLADDLSQLHSIMGVPDRFPFYLVEMEAKATEAFKTISKLPKGQGETAEKVITALSGEPLFDFSLHRLQNITGTYQTRLRRRGRIKISQTI